MRPIRASKRCSRSSSAADHHVATERKVRRVEGNLTAQVAAEPIHAADDWKAGDEPRGGSPSNSGRILPPNTAAPGYARIAFTYSASQSRSTRMSSSM